MFYLGYSIPPAPLPRLKLLSSLTLFAFFSCISTVAVSSESDLTKDSIKSFVDHVSHRSNTSLTPGEVEEMQSFLDTIQSRKDDPFIQSMVSDLKGLDRSRISEGIKQAGDLLSHLDADQLSSAFTEDDVSYVMPASQWIDILISKSMSDAEIKDLMHTISLTDFPVRVVLRGIEEGTKINDLIFDIRRWTLKLSKVPEVIIDPTIFSSQNVTSVPTMFYRDNDQILASVTGLSDPDFIIRAVEESGLTGDLGIRGPVLEVTERDLIEVMQERLLDYDFDAQKQKTINTYWSRADMLSLPPAPRSRTRLVDPTVTLQQDMVDADGQIHVPKGTTFNQLEILPFKMRLIVFNPNNPLELDFVASLDPLPIGYQDIYMFTELNREDGWNHYQEVQTFINDDLYTLTSDVVSRFSVEHTPSIITANDVSFIVTEISLQDIYITLANKGLLHE